MLHVGSKISIPNFNPNPIPAGLHTIPLQMLHLRALPNLMTVPACGAYWRSVRKCCSQAFNAPELAEDFEVAKVKSLILVETLAAQGPGGEALSGLMQISMLCHLWQFLASMLHHQG